MIRLSVAAEESEPVPARAGRLRRVAVFRPWSGVWPGVREADRPRPAVLLRRMRSVSPPDLKCQRNKPLTEYQPSIAG